MTDSSREQTPTMRQIMDEYASLKALAQEYEGDPGASCAAMLAEVLARCADVRDVVPFARQIITLIVPDEAVQG